MLVMADSGSGGLPRMIRGSVVVQRRRWGKGNCRCTGLALVFIPVASTALHAIGGHDAGVPSALINTSQQVGGSLGIALLNTVAAASTTTYLASHRVLPPPVKAALTHGYTQAFMVGAGFLLVAAMVAGLLITIGKAAAAENYPVPGAEPARRRGLPLLPGRG